MSPLQRNTLTRKFCRKGSSKSVACASEMGNVTRCQKRYDLEKYVEIEVREAS